MAVAIPLAIATTVVGGAVGAMGAIKEGEAKAAAANKNAQIAQYNSQVSERNKGIVLSQSAADAADNNRELTRTLSTIRASYGASGVALEGSPLDVIADTAMEKSLDTAKIRYKGEVQAAGYTDEANNYTMKGELYKQEAEYAPQIAALSATSQFLGGASKGLSMWGKG